MGGGGFGLQAVVLVTIATRVVYQIQIEEEYPLPLAGEDCHVLTSANSCSGDRKLKETFPPFPRVVGGAGCKLLW